MSADGKADQTPSDGDLPTELETSKEEESFTSHDSLPTENDTEPPPFDFINENVYIVERGTSRDGKRSKRMMCNCQFDPETDNLSEACGDNCLNRLLMIECGSRCPCGEYCNNKRFTRKSYVPAEVIKTEKKGWGLKATADVKPYSFVMEYCGEVCTIEEFERRRGEYEKDKRRHYYFMSLKTDEILDATKKGNYSRFINHSCDPNCETQKWTVNGRLCVGFFSLHHISAGEELTFDYQFQRFGESAQKCYCGSDNCRGYLGATKQSDSSLPGATREKRGVGKRRDSDSMFEKELHDVVGSAWRLKNIDQVLSFSRLMLRAESLAQRTMLLKVLQATRDTVCLKRFLSFQGLRLLWSWMVELTDQHTMEALDAREQCLPIPNKNVLTDNKILQLVQKWAETKSPSQPLDQESVVISEADCSISQDNEMVKESDSMENKDSENEVEMKCQENDDKVISPDHKLTDDVSIDEGSEAEGREAMAIITDEDSKVISLASDLLTKWSSLKEVFRIPKKPLSKIEPVPSISDVEQQKRLTENNDMEGKGKRKKDSQLESNNFIKMKINPNLETATAGLLGSPPVGYHPPPLQNTLIVQSQPGQSLYVQQQIFPPPGPNGLFPSSPHRLVTPEATHRLVPVAPHRLITHAPHGFIPSPHHGLAFPGSVTPVSHVLVSSNPHGLISHRLTTPSTPPTLHGSVSSALVTSVPHGLVPPTPYGSVSTGTVSHGLMSSGLHGSGSTPYRSVPTPHGSVHAPHGSLSTPYRSVPGSYEPVPTPHGVSAPYGSVPTPHGSVSIPYGSVPASHGPVSVPHGLMTSNHYVPFNVTTTTTFTSLQPLTVSTSSGSVLQTAPPPWPVEKELPPNWKKTKEASGKVYYYHIITRKTQWDRPTEDDRDGDILMDIATPDIDEDETTAAAAAGQPHTPEDSPPSSPLSQPSPAKKSSTAPKDVFKHSLSKLIVRCLDHHRKPNCKYGRITCSEDFKHLARKLTFGITEKELARKGSADALEFNDQVKSRAKAYIKNYMKKFGPVYSHS